MLTVVGCLNTKPGGSQWLLQASNIDDATAKSLELGPDGHSEQWRWGASCRREFIHDDLNFTQYKAIGTLTVTAFYQGDPHHWVDLHGGVTWDQWDFALFGRYSSADQLAHPVLQGRRHLLGGSFNKCPAPGSVPFDARHQRGQSGQHHHCFGGRAPAEGGTRDQPQRREGVQGNRRGRLGPGPGQRQRPP